MSNVINVGFIGNPNCGKTTLFNAFTGANLKVANWPGCYRSKKRKELLITRDRNFVSLTFPAFTA